MSKNDGKMSSTRTNFGQICDSCKLFKDITDDGFLGFCDNCATNDGDHGKMCDSCTLSYFASMDPTIKQTDVYMIDCVRRHITPGMSCAAETQ